MPFTKKPHAFKAAINEVTLGTGDKAVTIGGETTYYTSIKDAVAKANESGNATHKSSLFKM